MYKIIEKNAFTLVEIMVVVGIIAFLIVGGSQINFSRLSQKQKSDIETIKIISIFEEVRNNALLGKSTLSGSTFVNPKGWEIRVEKTGSGKIIGNYSLIGDFTDSLSLDNSGWDTQKPFFINTIICKNINGSGTNDESWASIRFFPSSKMELRCGDTSIDAQDKILEIKLSDGVFNKVISINTLTGVIE